VRVVFLANHYPRWAGDRSGAALSVLARALMRRGISVRVVAPTDEKAGESELDGVQVHRVKSSSTFCDTDSFGDSIATAISSPVRWLALLRLWRVLRAAARREIAAGADLIHAHGWVPAGLASPPAAPFVLTVQGPDASLLRRSRIARSLARGLLHRAAAVTTISREAGSWIQNGVGRHVEPAHIHPMPIDTRGHPWTRGGGGAVVIGRLVDASRMVLAIEATAVLVSNGHDLPLTIIGDGPGRSLLERRAAELGISSLTRFAGDASPEETRRILERADVLLFTARGDGMALAVFQALISGIPVVACWDSGAAVDIVPASGAGRLSLPSPEAVADSVLGLQADTDRLAIARLVGESWRARLAPDHVAELCEGWYRDALAV
jgi:glycosyltransferase involved in cell wall biosynthesis